jgi:histidine ammonia-lyase
MNTVIVGTGPVSCADVVAVARDGAAVTLSTEAEAAIAAGRRVIDTLAHDTAPHYGVSTGFGALATRHIPVELRLQLQRSLVRSHAAGSGHEVEAEVVRAMMLLRLSTLATGRTGVRLDVARSYAAMLSSGITPVVREYGSLGCSGDLAPLAHCALAAMGEGTVRVTLPDSTGPDSTGPDSTGPDSTGPDSTGPDSTGPDSTGPGPELPAAQALAAAGIEPLVLAEKEGLALINGTDGMLGMLVLAAADLRALLTAADITAAMSVEALLGTDAAFDAGLQVLRPHPGQAASAANLRMLLAGSPIVASHRGPEDTRVQDAYSLRCSPQVHGAARDTLAHATAVAGHELASAIDNPVVTTDGRVVSNGNFHGAPVAYVLDFLAIVTADVASIAERRTDRMLDPARSHGLPPFLADDPGVDSGHMIAQYTQAAIVSELKRLAVPASVDSIPSSAMQEDHVSMGWSAARKLRRAVDGLTRVLAVELLTAARALPLRSPLEPAPATAAVVAGLRAGTLSDVAVPATDRFLAPEIEAAVAYVASGAAVRAAEAVTGPLELRAAREQPLEERQGPAHVHRVRLEEPLDLQAVRRGDHQRGRVHRVDVRGYRARPLPGLDPRGEHRPQRAESFADEFPGHSVLLLQRVGGEGRVQLHQAGDRAVPLGGPDDQPDGRLAGRERVHGSAGLVRPVGRHQQLIAGGEVMAQRRMGHPDRLAHRPQRRPVPAALGEQRDHAVQDLLPAPHPLRVRAMSGLAPGGLLRHPAIVRASTGAGVAHRPGYLPPRARVSPR